MSKENLKLWDSISTSNPWELKEVNMRGGFIAINPHSQVKKVTDAFGVVGEGWSFESEIVSGTPDNLCVMKVWVRRRLKDRWSEPISQYGQAEWVSAKGRVDPDAAKKATTDGLTKCFSYWGFNADVFLGEWDDKNVKAEQQKVAPPLSTKDMEEYEALSKTFEELLGFVNDKKKAKEAKDFVDSNPTIIALKSAITRLKDIVDSQ